MKYLKYRLAVTFLVGFCQVAMANTEVKWPENIGQLTKKIGNEGEEFLRQYEINETDTLKALEQLVKDDSTSLKKVFKIFTPLTYMRRNRTKIQCHWLIEQWKALYRRADRVSETSEARRLRINVAAQLANALRQLNNRPGEILNLIDVEFQEVTIEKPLAMVYLESYILAAPQAQKNDEQRQLASMLAKYFDQATDDDELTTKEWILTKFVRLWNFSLASKLSDDTAEILKTAWIDLHKLLPEYLDNREHLSRILIERVEQQIGRFSKLRNEHKDAIRTTPRGATGSGGLLPTPSNSQVPSPVPAQPADLTGEQGSPQSHDPNASWVAMIQAAWSPMAFYVQGYPPSCGMGPVYHQQGGTWYPPFCDPQRVFYGAPQRVFYGAPQQVFYGYGAPQQVFLPCERQGSPDSGDDGYVSPPPAGLQ